MDGTCSRKRQKKMEAGGCSWSELPGDLLAEIAGRVLTSSAVDFTSFRKVCRSWRSAPTKELFFANFSKPWPSVPYMMLPEKKYSDEREFYSPVSKKIFMTPLPEARGKRCIEVRFGWLLTLTNTGEVKLLNPITRAQIHLPSFSNFSKYVDITPAELQDIDGQFEYKVRAVLSANPSHSSDFVLAVVIKDNRDFGFWKNGDEDWTRVVVFDEFDEVDLHPLDVTYRSKDRKFYVVSTCEDQTCFISVLDPNVSSDAEIFGQVPDFFYASYIQEDVYIAESASDSGGLLLVKRNGQKAYQRKNKRLRYGTTRFDVVRVDVDKKVYEKIGSLQDEAIFVGNNASLSIPASKLPGGDLIKPNCIYFSDDSLQPSYSKSGCDYFFHDSDANCDGKLDATNYKGGGKNMGIYNLQDRSIQRFHQSVKKLSFVCPPMWISLSSLFS